MLKRITLSSATSARLVTRTVNYSAMTRTTVQLMLKLGLVTNQIREFWYIKIKLRSQLRWSWLTWFQIRSSIYETFHMTLHNFDIVVIIKIMGARTRLNFRFPSRNVSSETRARVWIFFLLSCHRNWRLLDFWNFSVGTRRSHTSNQKRIFKLC